MIRVAVVVLALMVAIGECKYHVIQTNAAKEKSSKSGMEALREYTRARMKQIKADDEIDVFEEDEGSGGTIITPTSTMVVYFENPSENYEEIFVRDFLPQRALIQDFHVHSEGLSFEAVEYDDKTEAEQAFFKASQEGRTSVMMGDTHESSSASSVKWLDSGDVRAPDEPSDVSQRSGMLMKVSPQSTFSLTLAFQEEVGASENLDEYKGLYSTHMSFQVGPRGTAIRGFVESPNYPDGYPDNADMKWLFHMPVNNHYGVKFTLNELDTEACCDRLIVYDGVTTNAKVLGTWSGAYADSPEFVVITETPDLLVQFQSDCYESTGMFSYTFESLANMEAPTCESNTEIIGTYGSLTSPGYPKDYPINSDCYWDITTTAGTYASLTIVEFDITERDTVSVFYYDGNYPVVLASYTGYQQPGLSVQSQNNNIIIRLISGLHEIPLAGFSFTYDSLRIPTACEEGVVIANQTGGYIQTENFPAPYANNSTCTWQVSAKDGKIVGFLVEDFSTQANQDVLHIFDGNNSSSDELAEISGDNGQERAFFTTQKDAYLLFSTDDSTVDQGFRIKWDEYNKYDGCYEDEFLNPVPPLEGTRGFISSRNYPEPYPGCQTCVYRIQTTLGTAVHLKLRHLDVGDDRLIMYDGYDGNSRVIYDTNSLASFGATFSVNATQNEVYMEFISTSANTNSSAGFEIYYYEISLDSFGENQPHLLGDVPQGTFQSALYPGWYPATYRVDTWLIITPVDTFVTVRNDDFNIGVFNTLKFYDGQDEFGDLLYTCSGNSCPARLTSNSTNMFVLFESDGSFSGFQFTYFASARNCDGALQNFDESNGYIASNNYPFRYNSNENCTWEIVTDVENDILFDLQFMDTESNSDILLVYDVTEDTLVANLSGIVPQSLFETGHHARVQFSSDEYTEGGGFELQYRTAAPKQNVTSYTCRGIDRIDHGEHGEEEHHHNTIYSHNYPQDYPANLDYCWVFVPPAGVPGIRLDFATFITEEQYDVVNIYGGDTTESQYLLESFSGALGAFGVDIITPDTVTVLFHTDNDITELGFVMEYSF